jgi:hypothetical protein
MSLDNIDSRVRKKSSTHSFCLLALLPKVSFPEVKDKKLNRTLRDRVLHECLRIILEPIRIISHTGEVMEDPLGQLRMCYTVLSMYIVDLLEAIRLRGVTSLRSPVTTAKSSQLGDSFRHKRRWLSRTKKTIDDLKRHYDPVTEIREFAKEAAKRGLTGVINLFWDGWQHCEPSVALTFDVLHSGHKYWADHMFQWCIRALGRSELDMRYSVLPHRIGYRHFSKGVTVLKKTGGRDFRDMQRFIMPVIDGGVPSQFSKLIRIHLDYFYIAQCVEVSEDDLAEILDLIQEFHANKDIVHAKGYRTTKGFKIPKLELQHHIVPTIMATGNLLGSSTDTTEHGHIEFVKGPYRMTNHRDFYPQMTDRLDKLERLRHFDLTTALHSLEMDHEHTSNQNDFGSGQTDRLDCLKTVENLQGPKREDHTDYFAVIRGLETLGLPARHARSRTFSFQPFTAIHLNRDPDISSISVEVASRTFELPDLHDAIKEYYYRLSLPSQDPDGPILQRVSRANSATGTELPFEHISVWFNVKVQTKSLAEPGRVNRQQTLCAEPKSVGNKWPFGRHDCALFINNLEKEFTGKANLQGGNLSCFQLVTSHYPIYHRPLCWATPPDISRSTIFK